MIRKHPLVSYFVIVFLWTWGVAAPLVLAPEWVERAIGPVAFSNPLFYLAVYGASLTGIVMSWVTGGREGLRRLFARLVHWRFSPVYYLLLLVGVPLLAAAVAALRGTAVSPMEGLRQLPLVLPVALLLDPGPIGEEFGWRGFAMPRLAERWGMIPGTVLLGAIWGIWHYPAFLVPTLPQAQLDLGVFVAGTIVVSLLQAWFMFRTGGSLLICILLHLVVNDVPGLFGAEFNEMIAVYALFGMAIILFDREFRTGRIPQPGAAS